VLGTCAGYAYADAETVSTMMSRLGLSGHACVRITQVVDAMFVYSTAIWCRASAVGWRSSDVGPDSSTLSTSSG